MYTSSALHASVLGHLCELTAQLPNLVVGLLTRASVLGALRAGISAAEIVGFLEACAHPAARDRDRDRDRSRSRSRSRAVPENVAIQLRMWEQERRRVSLSPAVVFKGWEQQLLPDLFQKAAKWAAARGSVLHFTPWPTDPTSPQFLQWLKGDKFLAVKLEHKPEVVNKIRELRQQLLAQRAQQHAQ
ncbi:hypothetical protein, conserved [Eimeria necatrix]|uniref:General transcription factor IIH subunit 4 n=1 Tax=Eimeria necatrix TaxID=51315 RepID=U6MXI7_9EIME|nr:hypothetical protein, conserved [Eimeria necatrix]CDJ66420.1 hypothetical protein, conserved [Eimeria necatrix]